VALADYGLQHPNFILLILPLIIVLFILIKLNLVKFQNEKDKKIYEQHKKKRRFYNFILHLLTLILLVISVSSPYTISETRDTGNPSLLILSDNSSSFSIFEPGIAQQLKDSIESEFPVSLREIASSQRSGLGDAILGNMQGDDNLLLVTDGRNTHGRDLGDILQLAYELNSTISALNVVPIKNDASIQILGPSQQIEHVETEFFIDVNKVGDVSCSTTIEVNGNKVASKDTLEDFTYKRTFPQGTHKIKASLQCNDFFPQNNAFFKTIRILPKPKILFVSKESSPLDHVLTRYYRYERTQQIPATFSDYEAIIINDFSADDLKSSVSRLTNYVAEGNGLVIVGGKNSYDLGGYKNSLIEAMLPVQVGVSDKSEEGSLNVVIVIDISGSTGATFGAGSDNKKVDVEKALAVDILKDIRANDKVGVVAFNSLAYEVSPLSALSDKRDIVEKISTLKDSGGTEVFKGLRGAQKLLTFAEGSKNIILISDGLSLYAQTAIRYAELLTQSGIKIHTVGVGENTDRSFMGALAKAGGGVYLEPDEHFQLRILLDNSDFEVDDKMKLTTLNRKHFITQNLDLTARVTGYNQVAPKQSARMLVTTFGGNPIVSEHRFGLGRVVSISTDDGTLWSGALFDQKNSLMWSRAVNFAIGTPGRKQNFLVSMEDTYLGDPIDIKVKSDKFPTNNLVTFQKVGDDLYRGQYLAKESGFYDFFGSTAAVNYPKEYLKLGIDPELQNLVSITGGRSFDIGDLTALQDFVKVSSIRIKKEITFLRWPFVVAAMIIFLLLLVLRRINR
jgi:uncharacterized membrane protein